jgi:hypothetical protein
MSRLLLFVRTMLVITILVVTVAGCGDTGQVDPAYPTSITVSPRCSYCGGTGQAPCLACSGIRPECGICGGSGWHECWACGGDGVP